jgi:hypothetical protein
MALEDHSHEDSPNEDTPNLSPLIDAFRNSLMACLEECARGRRGLFSDTEDSEPWPEAAQLRQLAMALQQILAQSEESSPLCDHFLDLCSIHGESDPGERKLARQFLDYIATEGL